MNSAEQFLGELLRDTFSRAVVLQPDKWAERFIRLTKRQSVNTGLYSLRRTPYFRRILQDLTSPRVRKIIIQKAAQVGASQLYACVLLWWIANKGGLPAAIVLPSAEIAQQFSERTLLPLLETTEPIKALLTGSADDIKRREFVFKNGCAAKIIGGGSATRLSSNPVCLMLIDEANKLKDFAGEASALELAQARTLSFKSSREDKVFIGSTPTIEHSCAISSHFKEGSASKWHCPCPHCGHKQELVFIQLKFDHCEEGDTRNLDRVADETFYECANPDCKQPIREAQKADMLNAGEWVDENPLAPADMRSYHVSALMSLALSWGDVARAFLAAKTDRSRLQDFYNNFLGLPFQPIKATVKDTDIDALIQASPRYKRGQLPSKARALVMACDTQQAEFYFLVLALLESGGSAVVDYGIAPTTEDLKQLAAQQFRQPGTEDHIGIHLCGIDAAGGRTPEVYNLALTTGGRFLPLYGRTAKHRLFAPTRAATINYKGYNVPILNVSDTHFSDLLLMSCLKFRSEPCYLPSDSDDMLRQQLSAVSIVEKKNAKGFIETDYEAKRANHLFDCLKYAFALRYTLLPLLDKAQEEPEEVEEEPEQEHFPESGW